MKWGLYAVGIALVVWAGAGGAALITAHTDHSRSAPALDGVISANEYGLGNAYAFTGGGAGFGGQFGQATLYMKADSGHLYIAFQNLGVPTDGNQYIVYFHTRPGGHQPDGSMNDVAGDGRRNASLLSLNGTETVTFNDGVTTAHPDFALVFNNRTAGNGGFSSWFELAPWGQSHGLVTHERVGLGTGTVEFSVPLTALGMASGDSVEVAALNISATGFLSNEGLPATGLASNPGFADGQTHVFADFHRFTTFNPGPQIGLVARVPNQTLNLPLELPADPALAYTVEDALGGMVFNQPVSIRSPPGETNRLFVSERPGTIVVVTNMVSPTYTTFLNIASSVTTTGEGGMLSFAFHPDYAVNGYFYVYYALSANTPQGNGFHTRLARFQVSSTNAHWASPNTEQILFTQYHRQSNHNGGDIHFGSDGYLYLSLGDEGGGNDPYNNGQRLDGGFFSSVIRIDVDKKPGSLAPNPHPAINGSVTNYAVPPDNPFIGTTQFNGAAVNPHQVRTEIYAIGLRNPFRMAFDPVTDELYVADVGQSAREEINIIVAGGNYGWKWREGSIATPGIGTPPAGFTNWINPVLEYTHGSSTNQGRSVTGGVVYRGDALPELVGRYIFGDYVSGHIWAMTHDGTHATSFVWLGGTPNIVSFGTDPRNGDVLIASLTQNRIRRLVRTTAGGSALPQLLSQTGVFHDQANLIPYAGIVPYDLNVPFWSDGALKRRWFSVPDIADVIHFAPEGPWTFPDGTVWIKHFDLDLIEEDPSSRRRLETRLLVKNDSGSGGYGVTYRWGASTDEAVLVPATGLNESFVIQQPGGVLYTQVWRYPSRTECLTCHQPGAGFALGFNTEQLNRDFDYAGTVTNQLCALGEVGYLHTNVQDRIHTLRALAAPDRVEYSVEYRARSYLHANCANCHFPNGPTQADWDVRIQTALPQTDLIEGLLINTQGNPDNRLIARGSVSNSMLHHRIVSLGGDRMPPVGSSVVDTEGAALVVAWINELVGHQTFAEWQVAYFGNTADPKAQPGADPDEDGADNSTEFLTGTDPWDEEDVWTMELVMQGDLPVVVFPQTANRGFEIQASTNLLDAVGWSVLNVPGNQPFFAAETKSAVVPDPTATHLPGRFYRVRIYRP